jgi:hypothetical protein
MTKILVEKAINPDEDGLCHINIYSQGKTLLGRLLSNFAITPITHPLYGKFLCLEGYWHYLATGCCHDEFKILTGHQAKSKSKIIKKVHLDDFEKKFKEGLDLKLKCHRNIYQSLILSYLPFAHYYVYGFGSCQKVIDLSKKYAWLISYFEDYRKLIQEADPECQF